jgi:phage terminase Nu1 subunit (DNA packaging protein)
MADSPIVCTRHQLATACGVALDTVTDWVRLEGLGAAVVEQGGHGRQQLFDLAMAWKWFVAYRGWLNTAVLEDMKFRAERRLERPARAPRRPR